MDDNISYLEIAGNCGISGGDTIYLASDVIQLALYCRKNDVPFSVDDLINSFQEVLTENGTLLIPVFNFDFSNKGIYDYRGTSCFTGAVGNAALRRPDFIRTRHPMHSFCVWGKLSDMFYQMDNNNSFGADSPFAYMHEKNVTQILLGTDYTSGFTFAHYCETCADVPYRFMKTFTGEYIDEHGTVYKRSYDYPARVLEYKTTEQFNRIGKILEERGIADRMYFHGIPIVRVRLGDAFDTVYQDAKYNMARSLYDFETPRELIWKDGRM